MTPEEIEQLLRRASAALSQARISEARGDLDAAERLCRTAREYLIRVQGALGQRLDTYPQPGTLG